MGTRSCGPLHSRVPALLEFSFAFRVAAFLYNIFLHSPVLLRSCFEFLVYVWGSKSSHSCCVCMDVSGGPGQLATTPLPPPHQACRVYESTGGKPVWGQTHVLSTIPPSTSPLSTSTCHNCVISSQEREFSVLFFCLPRSCIKFAFPRTRVPKIPGTRERGNAKQGTRAHLCKIVCVLCKTDRFVKEANISIISCTLCCCYKNKIIHKM